MDETVAEAPSEIRANSSLRVPKFGATDFMLDSLDYALLNEVQRDDARTADHGADAGRWRTVRAARRARAALQKRLGAEPAVQLCYDVTGPIDVVVLFDCANMAEFTSITDRVLLADTTVRRYETHFVRREVKFAPFVPLG